MSRNEAQTLKNSQDFLSWSGKWLLAARPKTLVAAAAPLILGTALAWSLKANVEWMLLVWATLSCLFIQIGTNLANDALDSKKGADTAARLGPTRVSASGLLSEKQVMWAAFGCFAAALLCGLPLVLARGEVLLVVGLMSIACGYFYTGGPFPLAYHGLGDLFVMIFFGVVAVNGIYFVHTGEFSLAALVASIQVGALSTVLIAINNLRDVAEDSKNRKRTLAVLLGPRVVRIEITLLSMLPYLLSIYWTVSRDWYLASLLPLALIPLSSNLQRGIWLTKPSKSWNLFLADASKIEFLFVILTSVGIIIGRLN